MRSRLTPLQQYQRESDRNVLLRQARTSVLKGWSSRGLEGAVAWSPKPRVYTKENEYPNSPIYHRLSGDSRRISLGRG